MVHYVLSATVSGVVQPAFHTMVIRSELVTDRYATIVRDSVLDTRRSIQQRIVLFEWNVLV